MGKEVTKYQELGKGVLKRKQKREVALFIDGTGLDRATRRLKRKVDLEALVRGVTSGLKPTVCRYYTLIPHEDDSRQRAFLDAVAKAGPSVIVKRLPPKNITRQVSVDVEMAADMIAFGLGKTSFSDLSEYIPEAHGSSTGVMPVAKKDEPKPSAEDEARENKAEEVSRVVTVVCASRELSYTFALLKELRIETINADFGKFNSGDILKSASKWIDLSDSETIWRE